MSFLADAAISGAENYYRYLESIGKGREVITVNKIEREDKDYLLYISKNPFSTDAVTILIKETEYDQRRLNVYEHDCDRRVLYVRLTDEKTDPLRDVRTDQVFVISDLKFLITRVRNWYERNPASLMFPCPPPLLQIEDYVQPDLSDDQKQAVQDVFTYSPSYVWGAPGTGKTRYVLSECLLQYYLAEKQVVVLAPTNNAIEQVLYGVLEKLQLQHVELEDVIRLGTPSMKFAERYGEICEVQGIEKRLNEIAGQIAFYNSILKHRAFLKRLCFAEEEILPQFDRVREELLAIVGEGDVFRATAKRAAAAERLVQSCHARQLMAKRALSEHKKRMQSFGFRISAAFSSSAEQNAQQKQKQLEETLCEAEGNLTDAQEQFQLATAEKENAQSGLARRNREIDAQLLVLSQMLAAIPGFAPIHQDLNRNKVDACRDRLLDKIKEGNRARIQGLEKFAGFQKTDDAEIESRIEELRQQRIIIAAQTTDERLKHVKIVAATIDTFLFRFQPADYDELDQPVPFQHIFLDEAGYCCLAKALTMFGFQRPVTMFGDHMQLPPVCEADDEELKAEQMENGFFFAQSALYAEEAFLCGDTIRLLKQYLNHEPPSFMELHKSDLRETYRFGPVLADALEKCVYQNGFRSANQDAPFVIEVLDATKVPGRMRRENPAEADAIIDRLQYLGTGDYAILTPYRNQVKLLTQKIPEAHREQRIMTIHASQGREWDTVFLSVVDTSDMYFTNSKRPDIGGLQIINTAVSRAKMRLIIVCDKGFWSRQEGQLIKGLIKM